MADKHEVRSATAPKKSKDKKKKGKVEEMRIKRGKKGGHVITHHMEHEPMGPYQEPETHIFGKSEGDKMMAHVANHMNVAMPEQGEGTGAEEAADMLPGGDKDA